MGTRISVYMAWKQCKHKLNFSAILAGKQCKHKIPEKKERRVLYLESKITGCLSASTELTTNWVCMALGT
jgi:hypothetical protein